MKHAAVRKYALSLAGVTEQPHFHLCSFRVAGKIFATMDENQKLLNVFVDEETRETYLAAHPGCCRKLWWGKKVVGLRLETEPAKTALIRDLLQAAWRRKVPKKLLGK